MKIQVAVLAPEILSPVLVDIAGTVRRKSPGRTDAVHHWWLVLASRNVPCHLFRSRRTRAWKLMVHPWFERWAEDELLLYLEENPPAPVAFEAPVAAGAGMQPTLVLMALLLLFFIATSRQYPAFGLYPELWNELGVADTSLILQGQWWRVVTALTLHADGAHVFGNACVGGVFILLCCKRFGSGAAWLLVLLSGAIGNAINAMAWDHRSIGFSTAVFGAAGILAGSRQFFVSARFSGTSWRRRLRAYLTGAFIPVAAGLGLLAALGSGGENTDLGAHLFGFAAGCMLGAVAGWNIKQRGLPSAVLDFGMLCLCPAAVIFCWVVAFSFGK